MNKRKAKSNLKLKELLQDALTKISAGKTLDEIKFGEICRDHSYSPFAKELVSDLCIQQYISEDYVSKVEKRIHERYYGNTVEQKSQWSQWDDSKREAFCIEFLKTRGYTGTLEREKKISEVVDL